MRRALALAAVLGLAGCWLQPGYGPARHYADPTETHLTPGNVARLAPVWSVPATSVRSEPLTTPSAVVIGGIRDNVIGGPFVVEARGRGSGDIRWQREMPVNSTFAGSDGVLLSAGPDHVLVGIEPQAGGTAFLALDPATGETVASVAEPGFVDLDHVVVDDSAFAYARLDPPRDTDTVVVRSRATLAEQWASTPLAFGEGRPVVVSGGRVYTDPRDLGTSTAFTVAGCGAATCPPVLRVTVPAPDYPVGGTSSTLLAATDDGDLLFRRTSTVLTDESERQDLVALAGDGSSNWTLPMRVLTALATTGTAVFVLGVEADDAHPTFELAAIDAATGAPRWRADGRNLSGAQPIVAGDLLYAWGTGTASRGVHAFAAGGCGTPTCAPIAVVESGVSGVSLTMSVSEGTLFINASDSLARVTALAPAP